MARQESASKDNAVRTQLIPYPLDGLEQSEWQFMEVGWDLFIEEALKLVIDIL